MAYVTIETAVVKRPRGATHFCPETDTDYAMWYKRVDGQWFGKSATDPYDDWSTGRVNVNEETLKFMIEL